MPLITAPKFNPTPTLPVEVVVSTVARQLSSVPSQSYNNQFTAWKRAMVALWENPHREAILARLGPLAKELFDLSTMQGQYLLAVVAVACSPDDAAQRTAEIMEVFAMVPECVKHEDGTVTIAPPPEPAE